MWEQYSAEFKEWFAGLTKAQQTKVINDGIERVPGEHNLKNSIMDKFKVTETASTGREKENALLSESFILEEAQVKVGGAQYLAGALARGAVQKFMHGNQEMYAFPKTMAKLAEHMKKDVTTDAESMGNQAIHDDFKAHA